MEYARFCSVLGSVSESHVPDLKIMVRFTLLFVLSLPTVEPCFWKRGEYFTADAEPVTAAEYGTEGSRF